MAAVVSAENAVSQEVGTMTDTEKRIAALEERIAHQERTIEDLSYISVKQWREISDLSDKIGYLKTKFEELEAGGETSAGKEPRPPHY